MSFRPPDGDSVIVSNQCHRGKIAADVCFYALAIAGYELQRTDTMPGEGGA